MTEVVRSDKVAGVITGVFGLLIAGFGAFGLVIVAFQRLMDQAIPRNTTRNQLPGFEHFDEMMAAVQNTFITYLPFMIAGGLIFGVAGYFIYRGSLAARRIAQINALLGFVWIIAYSIRSYRVLQTMIDLGFPLNLSPASQLVMIIGNTIFMFVFPSALLYILKRPKAAVEG